MYVCLLPTFRAREDASSRVTSRVAAVGRVQWPACLGRKRLRRSVVTGVVLSLPHVAILKRLQRTSASRRAAHGRALHGPGAAVILRAFSPAVCTGSARLGFEAGRRVGSATAGQLRQRDQGRSSSLPMPQCPPCVMIRHARRHWEPCSATVRRSSARRPRPRTCSCGPMRACRRRASRSTGTSAWHCPSGLSTWMGTARIALLGRRTRRRRRRAGWRAARRMAAAARVPAR